jgi:hypothetical protein
MREHAARATPFCVRQTGRSELLPGLASRKSALLRQRADNLRTCPEVELTYLCDPRCDSLTYLPGDLPVFRRSLTCLP